MNVAGNIKFYISEKGIKQTTLSKKSGIAPPKLNLILSGKQRLTVSDYVAICKALIVWHRLTPLRTIGDLTLFLPCTHPSVSTRRATPSGLSPSAHMTHTTPGTLSSTRTSSTGR